jgi:hypothetical protein
LAWLKDSSAVALRKDVVVGNWWFFIHDRRSTELFSLQSLIRLPSMLRISVATLLLSLWCSFTAI